MATADHSRMRRARSTSVVLASLAAALIGAPAAGASQPGDTEHGVNRSKLARKAERVVEQRNGIEVLKISKCGPQKRKGRLNYSIWVCRWRAEGVYPGEVPYHCAGKAVWKRKRDRWRVERCENRLQPMAPLLDDPGPPPVFGFNEDWITQTVAALDLLDRTQSPGRAHHASRGAGSSRPGAHPTGTAIDVLYDRLMARGIRPLWVLLGAPCFAQPEPGRLHRGRQPASSDAAVLRRARRVRRRRRAGATRTRSGSRSGTSPTTRSSGAARRSPATYAEMLKTVADALHVKVPGTTVVSAGLSPHADTDTSGSIGFRDFLIKMYERGAAQRGRRDRHPPLPGGRARAGLPRRRARLPGQDPERHGPLQRRPAAAVGDRVRRVDHRRAAVRPGGRRAGGERAPGDVPRGSAGSSWRSSTASSRSRGCRAARAASAC